MIQSEGFIAARDLAARRIALASWLLVPVAPLTAWLAGNGPVAVALASTLFAVLGNLGGRARSDVGRIAVGLALTGQAIAITASLAGHPWQLDSHMLFFALLAVTMAMSDAKVIVASAAAIAVHHLALSIALPALLYPSADLMLNIERTVLHGAIVVVEAAVLWLAIRHGNRMDAASVAIQEQLRAASTEAQDALARAEDSARATETALAEARQSSDAAESARATAEAETEKARAADLQARETETRERDARARIEAEQVKVVEALREGLRKLSNRDLSASIDEAFAAQYEDLRQDFNSAVKGLREAIDTVLDNAGAIMNDAKEISGASEDLARRTETQAATLEQTTASISQISTGVRESAEGARRANEVVRGAHSDAESSGQVVQQAVSAMSEIETSSEQITKIISVIDDIAFQTNLLALNAGVEAARAGDAGRGFAVVASEVRALAQRSSDAAREINTLISTSGEHVNRGVSLVGQAGDALKKMMASVSDIADHVSAIASSAEEQSTSIGEINTAMLQLDQVTQQNAAMFEETSAASQALTAEAERLNETMARFQTGRETATVTALRRPAVKPAANAPAPAKAALRPTPLAAPAKVAPRPAPARPVAKASSARASAAAPAPVASTDGWEEF